MNIKIEKILVIFLSCGFIFFLISSSKEVSQSVAFSISIWKDNLFPTLFPFFVVTNILIQYGFVDIIGSILKYPMKKLFKLPASCGFVLGISLLSGFPSGAKYTRDLLNNNLISEEEANRLLTFTHYSNPLFILGFIGFILNKELAFIILISHILAGIITGILVNYNKTYSKDNYISFNQDNDLKFGKCLQRSIDDSLDTMFFILGIVTIFLIFTEIINTFFNLSIFSSTILSGLLEMTQGIKKLSLLNISNYLKCILTTIFISFGGFSVHMQVIGVISDTKIKYKPFFIARIIHSLLAILLVSILFVIIN